jgi:hypothetical protein
MQRIHHDRDFNRLSFHSIFIFLKTTNSSIDNHFFYSEQSIAVQCVWSRSFFFVFSSAFLLIPIFNFSSTNVLTIIVNKDIKTIDVFYVNLVDGKQRSRINYWKWVGKIQVYQIREKISPLLSYACERWPISDMSHKPSNLSRNKLSIV